MTDRLVVVGAGGFGREVIDVVDAINDEAGREMWHVMGVVDDAPSQLNLERLGKRGVTFLGAIDAFLACAAAEHYVVGIGSPAVRRALADMFDAAGWAASTVVHPSATIGFDVRMGDGTVACAGARMTTNISIGRHVHLNPNVTIGHDTILGDFVSMNPASSVSGDCVIEDGVLIGVGGVVLNQLTVGRGATVGGAACVVKNVPPGAVVKGVPAK